MKKILIVPNKNNIDMVLDMNADGIILPIKGLSCNYDIYFDIDDIKKIINITSMEICVVINKIFHNKDLKLLESVLVSLNKLNISKIFFYDMAVINMCNRLNIKKDLVIYQEHLNASDNSNVFYKKRGIKYSVISNDITIDEINDISKDMSIILNSYGYLPIFYSRRYLVSNYLKYVGRDNNSDIYFINHNGKKYPIREEEEGCVIYTDRPINLINEIDNINCDYVILNSFNVSNDEFYQVFNDYINHNVGSNNNYTGFLNKKTVYKVSDYE